AYLSFAAFVAFLLLARPGSRSCGCAGAKDTPPSVAHAIVNLAAAIVALGAAFAPPPGLVWLVASMGWTVAPLAIGLTTAAALIVVLATEVPSAFGAYRAPSRHPLEGDRARHARADSAL